MRNNILEKNVGKINNDVEIMPREKEKIYKEHL
jgi:hypothetical protein